MSLLEQFRQRHPELSPTIRFPTERGLEAYMENTLRELFGQQGIRWRLERMPDGRFLGKTEKGGQSAVALSFEGWKALVKAYLSLAYDRGGERATAQTRTPEGRPLG